MYTRILGKSFVFFLLLAVSFTVNAQITVVESHKSDTTDYNNSIGEKDSILVFYFPDIYGNDVRPTLRATLQNASDDLLNFEWYKYNETTSSYESLGVLEQNVTKSEIEDAVAGGYKVVVTNDAATIDTSFRVWLNRQLFELSKVDLEKSECDFFHLKSLVNIEDTFTYFNPFSAGAKHYWVNEVNYQWLEKDSILDANTSQLRLYDDDVPTENTRYWLKLTDKLKFERKMQYDIDEDSQDKYGNPLLIAVDAKFRGIGPEDDDLRDSSLTPFQAPFGVLVFNESSSFAELFEWTFYDYKKEFGHIYQSNLFEPIDSIHYNKLPKELNSEGDSLVKYDVYLKVFGPESEIIETYNKRCMDSVLKKEFVQVLQSTFPKNDGETFFEIPNVFTPFNDDGINDYFYFTQSKQPKSISYFSIKIYNRWGNKIYEYKDDNGSWNKDGNAKPGWDGNTRFGGKVKPGVYYYSAKAVGYNDVNFEANGFFHVFY